MNEKYIPGQNGQTIDLLRNTVIEVNPLTEVDEALLKLSALREAFGLPLVSLGQEMFLSKKKQNKAIMKIKNLYEQHQAGTLKENHPGLIDLPLLEEKNSSQLLESYKKHLEELKIDGSKSREIAEMISSNLESEPKKAIRHLTTASNGAINGSIKARR